MLNYKLIENCENGIYFKNNLPCCIIEAEDGNYPESENLLWFKFNNIEEAEQYFNVIKKPETIDNFEKLYSMDIITSINNKLILLSSSMENEYFNISDDINKNLIYTIVIENKSQITKKINIPNSSIDKYNISYININPDNFKSIKLYFIDNKRYWEV